MSTTGDIEISGRATRDLKPQLPEVVEQVRLAVLDAEPKTSRR